MQQANEVSPSRRAGSWAAAATHSVCKACPCKRNTTRSACQKVWVLGSACRSCRPWVLKGWHGNPSRKVAASSPRSACKAPIRAGSSRPRSKTCPWLFNLRCLQPSGLWSTLATTLAPVNAGPTPIDPVPAQSSTILSEKFLGDRSTLKAMVELVTPNMFNSGSTNWMSRMVILVPTQSTPRMQHSCCCAMSQARTIWTSMSSSFKNTLQ